jgi:micrococcal nuclease
MRAGPSHIMARMLRRLLPLIVLAVAVLAGARTLTGGGDGGGGGSREGTVVRVVDGDTIRVRLGGVEERVRYIGVDTPESVKPGTPVQCFAKAASAFNARMVAGRRVRLVPDAEARDRYGRMLAYVYREPDGLFVNAELVRRGYAHTMTIPPNVRYAARFSAMARSARTEARGLWAAC